MASTYLFTVRPGLASDKPSDCRIARDPSTRIAQGHARRRTKQSDALAETPLLSRGVASRVISHGRAVWRAPDGPRNDFPARA